MYKLPDTEETTRTPRMQNGTKRVRTAMKWGVGVWVATGLVLVGVGTGFIGLFDGSIAVGPLSFTWYVDNTVIGAYANYYAGDWFPGRMGA